MFDVLDRMIAASLNVPVEEYIRKIESLDQDQVDSIISRLISDDDKLIEEGKTMFNDIDA